MEWEEYKEKRKTVFNYNGNLQYNLQETNIKCPKCKKFIYRDVGIVLSTYPPQYRYICMDCGWQDTYY